MRHSLYAAAEIFKSIPLSPSNAFSSLYDADDSPEPETVATESSQLNICHEHASQLIAVVKLLHGSESSLNRKNKNFVIDCSAEVFSVISKYHSINIKCISIVMNARISWKKITLVRKKWWVNFTIDPKKLARCKKLFKISVQPLSR